MARKVKKKVRKRAARKVVVVKDSVAIHDQLSETKPAATTEIKATPDSMLGRYCNVAVINHSKREFTLDFAYAVGPRAHHVARLATSPAHAKELFEVLGRNIAHYEEVFGPIDTE